MSFPVGQGIRHSVAASAVRDGHLACLHHLIAGAAVALPIQIRKILTELLPWQARGQDSVQGVKAGVVVRQELLLPMS
jgi:hypothetical protein